MRIVRDNGGDWTDDDVRDALRSLYAAPAEESYWDALERRILTGLRAEGVTTREWYSYFRGWMRLGLAAAAVAALVAGIAAYRTRETRERLAYKDLLGTPSTLSILSEPAGNQPNESAREATLRYLLSQ
jgi:hypothetical protein